ncbi:uncharacterized protein LOC125227465 [Leguminivora glycinivorella]|uniref:uncharacterized protein LOC125227465 n=1 Tax=Leguminivora glycinivorella TaxID=1035111 RepID=UPI00200CF517|nr:uncharacterized protein LOC125227465 [Leguminivora glycinivorella]
MFKHYKDLCDVVSLLAYCSSERSYLLNREANGEYWLPSCKTEKNCWNITAQKINVEIFGSEASSCQPLQVLKTWLPDHETPCVYHAVYKTSVKSDVKKRMKNKNTNAAKNRQWVNSVELDRLRAHCSLRSPEIAMLAALATGDQCKDQEYQELKSSMLVEVCEENTLIGPDCAGSLVAPALQQCQLLSAANYKKEDQIRVYREFTEMVYPAQYMSPHLFKQLMVEVGWQYQQCPALFRAADMTNRGGLSFHDLLMWIAALEPVTQHSGSTAEIRCKYIFRYFDSDRDQKLDYAEFKELVAAARLARQLPIDALSVARDADNVYRQLNLQPNSQMSMTDYLRGVSEARLRGTSAMLRAKRGVANYLVDLQQMKLSRPQAGPQDQKPPQAPVPPHLAKVPQTRSLGQQTESAVSRRGKVSASSIRRADYAVASYSVRVRRQAKEMLELTAIDEEAVSPSALNVLGSLSLEVLGPTTAPVAALAAVKYFASSISGVTTKRPSVAGNIAVPAKLAWSWATKAEEADLGNLIIKLADAVANICVNEPRMLRIRSPIYAVGDLHGNLAALLAMETAFWPMGPALAPTHFLFLGDYVDRGPHGSELIAYLLAAKLQRPQSVLLIRGNHETRDIQKMFTFYTECITKYGEVEGGRVWSAINHVFDALPLAAVVDDKVFCCHGGIPPPWVCPLISAIDKVPVPLPKPSEQSSIAWELLWNDPVKPHKITATQALELAANEGFAANSKRGTGHVFDQSALDRFLLANQLSHVLRAHEVHQAGFMCQLRGKLISVFSSSRYCGGTNDSGVALLDDGKMRLLRINAD